MYKICTFIALFTVILILIYSRWVSNFYRRLFEVESVFEGKPDFIPLCQNFLSVTLRETASDAGIIFWHDHISGEYKVKTLTGLTAGHINIITRTLRKENGLIDSLQKSATGYFNINLQTQPDSFTELAGKFKSLVVTPFRIKDHTEGFLTLFKKKGHFKHRELKFLELFMPRASVWLEYARLYQLTKETASENARLYVNIFNLYNQATRDELTGLLNRNLLQQQIKKAVSEFKSLAVIISDIDFFKNVNDMYGHQVGDEVLKAYASLITENIRKSDAAFRFGGEEFIVLLPKTDLKSAFNLAERLRRKTAEHIFLCSAGEIKITASFGVASYPDNIDSKQDLDDEKLNYCMEALIAMADSALYQAKKAGRNRTVAQEEKNIM